VASLLIPADCQWGAGPAPLTAAPLSILEPPPAGAIEEAARRLHGGAAALLLGGSALSAKGLQAAARLAAACACPVWIETFPARQECGRQLPHFPALPYFPEQAIEALAGLQSLVLAGARDPVAFFAEPDQPSRFLPEGAGLCTLADPEGAVDAAEALEVLAAALGAPAWTTPALSPPEYQPGSGPLTPDGLCRTLAALIPERAIVVNEATTTGLTWNAVHAAQAAPHTMLFITGGAIGQGLPNALGAALACPDRRVIAFQADGSGLYTLQALWSMARENVDVTVVVCANRCYRILQIELARAGVTNPGAAARSLTDLSRPEIDWRALAQGLGVPACRVHTELDCGEALRRSFSRPGPSLIEAVLT
jgi:acetolactate synthase-1/2/3 large subunit